jgi:curli biogenesis system outer membrane secretion channel CsgG
VKKLFVLGAALLVAQAIFVASADARSHRPVMAVAEFHDNAGVAWWNTGVGWDLSDMLTNELADTGDFRMVERSKLQHVLGEQDLGASGRVSRHTAARIGKLTGARYLVMGSISSFQQNTQSSGGGFSIGGISIGNKSTHAYIAVDLRVVNTRTGEIEYSRTVEAHTKGSGVSLGLSHGGFSGHLNEQKKTPAGKAIRAVIMEASDYLSCVMVERDSCMKDYAAKERRRRRHTLNSVDLE